MLIRLVTARLLIEPLGSADLDAFVDYRRRPEVARYQSWDESYSRENGLELVARQPDSFPAAGQWMQLAMRDGKQLVGDLALHTLADQPDSYEVGVTVGVPGCGYATEGMLALLAHLFEHRNAHRVIARSDARNAPVSALLTRVGFRHEGRAVAADWFKGEWTTVDSWAKLSEEPES